MSAEPRRPRLARLVLPLVPARWRDAVASDFDDERAGASPDVSTDLQRASHILRIAVRFRLADMATALRQGSTSLARGLDADVRLAFRMIRREPASTMAVVVTLALGIGATTAAFAIFNAVLFRPVPGVPDPARLVTLRLEAPESPETRVSYSPSRLADRLQGTAALDGPAVGYKMTVPVVAGAQGIPERRDVIAVRAGYLPVLGVRARLGRLITDEEARGGADVALISERFWNAQFAGAPSAIGATLLVDGQPFTVVGVLNAYEGWGPSRIGTVAVWIAGGSGELLSARVRKQDSSMVIGRLRPGMTLAAAESQLRAAYVHAPPAGGLSAKNVPVLYPGLHADGSEDLAREVRAIYPLAMGATAVLLLLACANAANLLLARIARRERALAVRSALGAGRARILRGIFIEAGVVAVAAAAAGLGVALLFTRTLGGVQPFRAGPTLIDVPLDWRVVGFASAVAAGTLLIFSAVPALTGSRADARGLLHQMGRATSGRGRARRTLVILQLALALVLVASAGVLTRSVEYLRGLPLGLNPDHVVEFSLDTLDGGEAVPDSDGFAHTVLARLAGMGGVEAAGIASPPAFASFSPGEFVESVRPAGSGEDSSAQAVQRHVSGGYFLALQIPVLRGRTFSDEEYHYLSRVDRPTGIAIVSETLARRLFGSVSSIGRHLTVREPYDKAGKSARDLTVVGVVGDVRSGWNYVADEGPVLYEADKTRYAVATFYIRSALPVSEMTTRFVSLVREVEPRIPLRDVMTLRHEIDDLFPEDLMVAGLMRVVAALALALGLFGVAAVMAGTLAERTRELGIRAALGASAGRLAQDVLQPAFVTSLAGVAIGLILFAAVSGALAARVRGVHVLDPLTLAASTLLLLAAALAAAWLPTRRATRVDPTITLRAE
ncbi:MAG: ABC transporter permease [Vicinamibacterales bacterium]